MPDDAPELLIAAVGSGWVFMINAATFAATIFSLTLMRRSDLYPMPHARRAKGQIREGIAYPKTQKGADPLTDALALVWTTTPWTLPSNLAIMVGEDIDYVLVESDFTGRTERYLLAEARLTAYANELGEEPTVLATYTGAELAGRSYAPPFGYFEGRTNAHRVLTADFVTTEQGTGLVHIAPSHGADDFEVWRAHGHHEVPDTVDADGAYYPHVPLFAGLNIQSMADRMELDVVDTRQLGDDIRVLMHPRGGAQG